MTYLEYLELWDELHLQLEMNRTDALRRGQIQNQISHLEFLIQRDGFEEEIEDYE